MGTNNRQRRAAKRRKARQARTHSEQGHDYRAGGNQDFGAPSLTERELASELLALTAAPEYAPDDELIAAAVESLCTLDREIVAAEAERHQLQCTGAVWNGGWQPCELVRQVQRAARSTAARLALVVVAADHQRRRAGALDPRWTAQLDTLALPHVASGAAG